MILIHPTILITLLLGAAAGAVKLKNFLDSRRAQR